MQVCLLAWSQYFVRKMMREFEVTRHGYVVGHFVVESDHLFKKYLHYCKVSDASDITSAIKYVVQVDDPQQYPVGVPITYEVMKMPSNPEVQSNDVQSNWDFFGKAV